jgi:pilus assembly protein Flp/PilA
MLGREVNHLLTLFNAIQVLKARTRDEEGQTVVEYALLLVLISVVAIAIMEAVGVSVTGVFQDADDALNSAGA